VADLIRAEGALGVLNLKDSEVMVVLIKLLHTAHINLVLQLSDTEILDLNRVGNRPLETDRYRRQVVRVLDELELGTAVQSLALKANGDGLAVHYLEEDAQMMLADFLRVVKYMKVHLLTRSQRSSARLNLEDLLVEDLLLKGLL